MDLIYISLMISDDESLFQVLFNHLHIFSILNSTHGASWEQGWEAAIAANGLTLVYWNARKHSCPLYQGGDDGDTGQEENDGVDGSVRGIEGLRLVAQINE